MDPDIRDALSDKVSSLIPGSFFTIIKVASSMINR